MTAAVAKEAVATAQPLKTLVQLGVSDCRFICEEPREGQPDWLYCGKRRKHETTAYCAEHHAIVFEPPQPKRNGRPSRVFTVSRR